MAAVVVQVGVADQALELVFYQFLSLVVPLALEQHWQTDSVCDQLSNQLVQDHCWY